MASLAPVGPAPQTSEPFSKSYKRNLSDLLIRFHKSPSESNAIAVTFCYYTLINHLYSEEETDEMKTYIDQFRLDKPHLLEVFSPFSPFLENFHKLSMKIDSFLTENPISVYSGSNYDRPAGAARRNLFD